jgi:hypothetical protein
MLEMTKAVALKNPIWRSNPGRCTGMVDNGIREDLDSFYLDTLYDEARMAAQIPAWRAPAPRAPARRLLPNRAVTA